MKGKFAQGLLEIQRRKSCPAVVGDGEEANGRVATPGHSALGERVGRHVHLACYCPSNQ